MSSKVPPPLPPSLPGLTPSLMKLASGEVSLDGLPARYGKYTLLRKIAQGGMAELFLALHKSVAGFEKLVVIKRVLPQMNQDGAFIEMLLHEARIAATLNHPNIVQIYDVGDVDGLYYIAMEHIHGEDIRSIVRQMKAKDFPEFPFEHALAIVQSVCSGLAYAHERRDIDGTPLNIVHRDVSPQNVLVTFSGDVKLVDFGIAKSDVKMITETKSGRLKGKVPYMSPEQARGEKLDARSDVFSTGVMLFELTTGRRLFKAQSEYETLKLICDRDYPKPSSVRAGYPPLLEAIVLKAIAKDRYERYQTAREMLSALEEYIRQERVPVSTVALQRFMQTLFEDKLASQKEELMVERQLVDKMERENTLPQSLTTDGHRSVTQSMPAAARTVTGIKKYTKNRGAFLGLVGFAALAGFGGYAIVQRQRPADNLSRTGTLHIESEPNGAAIYVNGARYTDLTPTLVPNLPFDRPIEIRFTKDGFVEERQLVVLSPQTPSSAVRAALKPPPVAIPVPTPEPIPMPSAKPEPKEPTTPRVAVPGRLNVDRIGGWCNVEIDGVDRGVTPLAGITLPPGHHTVTCTPPEGKKITSRVVVTSGETARYKFSQ